MKWEQDAEELLSAWRIVPPYKSYLEIGTSFGGSLSVLGAFAAIALGVDAPKATVLGMGKAKAQRDSITYSTLELLCSDINADVILGSSRDPKVIEEVREKAPFDLIFIDGDHRYHGVKADWEAYGSMGKIVMFHDTIACPGVAQLFAEIDRPKIHIEGTYGIGVVF